jgi:hypothetical protein
LEILSIVGGSWALFEAISWGDVGIWLPTSGLYKLGAFESIGIGSDKVYAENFPRQSHFDVGKFLRREPLWAISRSSIHLISVTSVLLGS